LVPHFEHKLFLTATPHNGYPESFTALLELLDNQRFARGTPPDRKQLEAVMVRRLKSELPPKWDGSPRFPKRVLEPLEVAYTTEERAIHAALRKYAELRQARAENNAEKFATEFVLKTLKKRLFSSPAAFAATLEQHEKSLYTARRSRGAERPSLGILQRELDRIEEDYADDGEYDEATTDAVDTASRLFSEPTEEELTLLKQMKEWAGRASAQLDSKAKELIRWLNDHLRPGKKWGSERVIVFTEYRATQNWLKIILATEGFTGGDRLLTMYGGMDPHDREAVKAAFQTAPDISLVRILLATDAASEGLDLQNHCSRLIHYEIPWNPNRMEQRNGRIDRHGQKASQVNVYHFVAKGYKDRESRSFSGSVADLEADLEFLMRVARKIETIREDLGKVGPVIAEQVEEAMLGRRTTLNTAQAEKDAGPVRRMLKFERDLAKQIKALLEQYHDTQKELRLSPENVEKVVEVALELAGQPPLVPTTLPDRRVAYQLPGLKGSWAACGDGLTHPHTQEVRPVVFDHGSAKGKDDVVLVHLNHRLAQMSLRLLRAEVWNVGQRKGLKRITARIVPDHLLPAPAIVAHARLVVIGGDSHRLHEEVITAGGFIKEGKFSRMKVGDIEDALAAGTAREPAAKVKDTLLALYPKLAPALFQALQARTEDRTASLQKKLAERANKEADDIRAILTELKRAIEEELDQPGPVQLSLFDDPERDQFERNKLALQSRLKEIPGEIERETEAVKARYADPQPRMFPVAVTFLVPERMA
jgi:hypothetical protein